MADAENTSHFPLFPLFPLSFFPALPILPTLSGTTYVHRTSTPSAMYVIYSAPDAATVHIVKGILDQRGIRTIVRGEHLQGASGGVAPIDAWVELVVLKMQDVPEAKAVVAEVISTQEVEPGEAWTCPRCGETIEAQFGACWSCGMERPADV
jgi:hypothetical protein